jgi:hypothetical protein
MLPVFTGKETANLVESVTQELRRILGDEELPCDKCRSSPESSRKGPDWKANHPCPYRNGMIWCAISGRGLWLFRLSRAKH